MFSTSVDPMKSCSSLIGVGDSEAGADKGTIDEDSRDLAELILCLNVTLFLLLRKPLNATEKTLDKGRAGVDLKHLLLPCELPHVLVVRLCMRRACETVHGQHTIKPW